MTNRFAGVMVSSECPLTVFRSKIRSACNNGSNVPDVGFSWAQSWSNVPDVGFSWTQSWLTLAQGRSLVVKVNQGQPLLGPRQCKRALKKATKG